jgi:hypothetical protein
MFCSSPCPIRGKGINRVQNQVGNPEVLKLHYSGMKVHKLANKFQLTHSTTGAILYDKTEYFEEAKNARSIHRRLIRKCEGFIPELEKPPPLAKKF